MSIDYLELSTKNCPVCENKDFVQLNNNDRYEMGLITVGCNHCGLIQTNPRPSKTGIEFFYSQEYRKFYQGVSNPSEEYIQQNNKYERMTYLVSFLNKVVNITENTVILDIGCSEGAFFGALRKSGFSGKLYGVELNKAFAEYAATRNNAEVYSTINDLNVSFDLIVVNHVFEHLLEPQIFLHDIKRLLKDDGVLFIDVPDVERYSSIGDLHLGHLFHYSTRTLNNFLSKNEYRVELCEPHDPPHHPKSVRLLAKKEGFTDNNFLTTKNTEISSWLLIRKLSFFNYKLKRIISNLPFAIQIWSYLKKLK